MQKQYPDRDAWMAIKRKPGSELTPEEKAYNRALSRIRIRVEHAIRRIKIFRARGDRYRNPRRKYGLINGILCRLVNTLRLQERVAGTCLGHLITTAARIQEPPTVPEQRLICKSLLLLNSFDNSQHMTNAKSYIIGDPCAAVAEKRNN